MLNKLIHCKADNFTDKFVESFKRIHELFGPEWLLDGCHT